MTTFEPGKTYACRSICDHNCVWTFTIASRTDKTIKTACGKTLRINRAITESSGVEAVFPLGRYSMAPVLSADKAVWMVEPPPPIVYSNQDIDREQARLCEETRLAKGW